MQTKKTKGKQSSIEEELEDTKGVIRNHKSKGRQDNVQKKKRTGKQSSTQEEFEDTEGVIRNHESKGRQCNVQKKEIKGNNHLHKKRLNILKG
jgi:hypothetical protein